MQRQHGGAVGAAVGGGVRDRHLGEGNLGLPLARSGRCSSASARPRCSRLSVSMAWERRPGSSTKLASIESYATPRSSTPARRSTCQSYLMLWPAFGTAGSRSSSASGAQRGSVSGGRFVHRRRRGELAAAAAGARRGGTRRRSALDGEREPDQLGVVRLERAWSRCRAPRAAPARSARDERREVGRVVHDGDAESRRRSGDRAEAAGGRRLRRGSAPARARPRRLAAEPSLCASEWNSSSASTCAQRLAVGLAATTARRGRASTGTSRWIVTSSRESRASSALRQQRLAGPLAGRPRPRGRGCVSRSPNSASSCRAPFSPMPLTPGTLSELSPTSAR